jgi:SAM-dependent methyltransferase
MTEEDRQIPQDRIFWFDMQEVTVADFDAEGYILDIGGGGEGIIGRLKGEQVIAVDPSRRELEEAPPGPLKVVMDATDLKFLDETFGTATSFCTLMYIDAAEHEKVFGEVFRVLRPGGRFLIWDAIMPPRVAEDKDIAVLPLTVRLSNVEVEAGYGVQWPEKEQDLTHYTELANTAGFDVADKWQEGRVLFLELRKP